MKKFVLIVLTVTMVYFGLASSVFAEDLGRFRSDSIEQPADGFHGPVEE